jgi:hypothetical protein
LKENIRNLDSKETIEKILQLRPVEYNLKQIYSQYDSLTESGEYVQVTAKRYDETRPFFKQKRYGLLAQEVQKIYPDLVYEAPDGYLGINYTGLVPILLQVIQEQQATLEAIQQQLADKKRMQNSASGADLSSNQFRKAELLQNAPNPFRENTRIDFYLPENVKEAFLFIYNMNGEQIKKFPLSQRQSANLTLKGQELKAGMYLYTLIADGSVVDTKQMILTK